MLDYLQKLHTNLTEQLQTLYKERADSGIETVGQYDNRINHLKVELEKLETEIQKYLNAKTPDNVEIFCYVIVSNKENVKNNIGEEYFELIESDRYHDTEISNWKPFFSKDAILNILQEFKNKTGYQFQEHYLDGDLSDEQWTEIDDNKKNSVVIVDLLSLYEQNKQIASRFDTEIVAGVLTPCCIKLIKNDDIYSFMQEIQSEVFHVLKVKMKTKGCSIFESSIPEFDNFYQKLLLIFKRNFPIKNKIEINSDVRNLNIGFQ